MAIDVTPRDILKAYEKASGEKVMLENWRQVKTLPAAERVVEKVSSLALRRRTH